MNCFFFLCVCVKIAICMQFNWKFSFRNCSHSLTRSTTKITLKWKKWCSLCRSLRFKLWILRKSVVFYSRTQWFVRVNSLSLSTILPSCGQHCCLFYLLISALLLLLLLLQSFVCASYSIQLFCLMQRNTKRHAHTHKHIAAYYAHLCTCFAHSQSFALSLSLSLLHSFIRFVTSFSILSITLWRFDTICLLCFCLHGSIACLY